MSNQINHATLNASELIDILEHYIANYGDRPVYFSDSFFRYGISCHPENSANFDSPKAILIQAFSLVTGMNGPNQPIDIMHE